MTIDEAGAAERAIAVFVAAWMTNDFEMAVRWARVVEVLTEQVTSR